MLLQMIPVANFVFMFTNHVAAAIWCANMYKAMIKEQENAAGAGAGAGVDDAVQQQETTDN